METFDGHITQALDESRPSAMVIALRETSTSQTHVLGDTQKRWVIGTGRECDVRLSDPCVSGLHCVLERQPNGALFVRDSESKNGTFVDGNWVEGAELRIGSYMTLGKTTLIAVARTDKPEKRRAIETLRGRDPMMRLQIGQALRAAQTDCSVLIVGETGTGKDLIARLIHESSRRSKGPFVAVNCGGIPRELIASELFGHERGAFTGALEERDGFFVEAHGGTLFLDEIGELPLELQAHLLRALETRRVRRVGGHHEKPVDVRIVAATNRFEGLGLEGSTMRLDLYHRLATMVLMLPPLRERISDLVELVESMLLELAEEFGPKTVSSAGWEALASYTWPGNVRELRHAVVRAVTLGGDELGPADFFPDVHASSVLHGFAAVDPDDPLVPYQSILRGAMEQALQMHGTIRAAALSLGMPKSTFADRAKQWGLLTRRRPRLPRRRPGTG